MIEFITVFLGLATGPQLIELRVDDPVARVAIEVDGKNLAHLTSAPWAFRLDLGPVPLPHLVRATAYDGDEREVDSDVLWLNLQAPATDEEFPGARSTGLQESTPLAITLAAGAELPSHADSTPWFQSAGQALEVERIERGGAEVFIVRDPAVRSLFKAYRELFPDHRLQPPEALWLDLLRRHLDVDLFDLEREAFRDAALELARREVFPRVAGAPPETTVCQRLSDLWLSYRHFGSLSSDTRVHFISPVAAGASQTTLGRSLYRQAQGEAGLGLLRVHRRARGQDFARRFADAVAVAGLQAQASGKRRAVVLLLGGGTEDQSVLAPVTVRAYLRALRVPLFVWSLNPDPSAPTGPLASWGSVRYVGAEPLPGAQTLTIQAMRDGFWRLDGALAALHRHLEAQRIVHLKGLFPPQEIELAPDVEALGLAGVEEGWGQ